MIRSMVITDTTRHSFEEYVNTLMLEMSCSCEIRILQIENPAASAAGQGSGSILLSEHDGEHACGDPFLRKRTSFR